MFITFSVVFVITLIAISALLKGKIAKKRNIALAEFANLENNFKVLLAQEGQFKQENSRKEDDLTKITNIYEITKDICEYLEESKIFVSFKKGLAEFIHFEACSYLTNMDARDGLSGFELIPLRADTENYGYLAIKGLQKQEKATLDILAAQFLTSIKRARLYKKVQDLSITDSLTRIFTRKYCLDRLEEELSRSKELDLSLSFLMADIDNFKLFNDKYGHLVGDVILKAMAEIIKSNCREIDLLGRFGGEEFMVILPMTPLEGAIFAAERIRKSIETTPIKAFDEVLNVTISIGISSFPQDTNISQELIDKADIALYHSKNTGKNKVTTYSSELNNKNN
ncbi:MAG: GGDEF domain-containing protein [Candidatus Omnitrophica bacterium]|nr:GGDEF domain-containing protein [Candidatus Omnitrophota bacterium]